jgi:hypothetical protein
MWKEGKKVIFSMCCTFSLPQSLLTVHVDTKVKERNAVVLASAAATLVDSNAQTKL